MRVVWVRSAGFLLVVGALGLARPLRAEAGDPEAARISAAGHSLKWNWTPPGRDAPFGHAETLIHAPLATVRRVVLDFANYRKLAPSIMTSRVVGHGPDGSTDVYLRMGVLNNSVVLWNVTRFSPLRRAPDGADEVLEGRMVPGKGNIDDSVVVWTLRAAGREWTVLKFDVLLRPGMPAPQALVDEQLRDSAMDVVDSIHDSVQGSKEILPYAG